MFRQNPNHIVQDWEEERERIRVLFRDQPEMRKTSKAALLRRLRTLEMLLDIEGLNYNSNEFIKWVEGE